MKFLVSGAGSMGLRHARNLAGCGATAVGLCDPEPSDEAKELASELGGTLHVDFEVALQQERPDAVFICTPTGLHISQALKAAHAQCHLFVEKPLSHSLEGLDELLSTVRTHKLITMVACNMRYHPGAKLVKKWLVDGEIGDPIAVRIYSGSYLPRWRRKAPYKESYSADPKHGGAILDCIHEIDLALYYFGSATLKSSYTVPAHSIGLQVDGLSEMILEHESGVLSSVHVNFIQKQYRRGCHIIGSRGSIEWSIRVPPGLEKEEGDYARVELIGEEGVAKEVVVQDSQWDRNEMYLEEVQDFLSAIQKGMQSPCSLFEGERALQIALDARKSMVS